MIPKIIHYCWFGKNDKPELLSSCIQSWKRLEKCGYEIFEWNEDNCDMSQNRFVLQMFESKKYAFVSDYFRLKALSDYGGIYFDTDVIIYKSFDDLLDCDMFIGYIYDFALGTAVIGASKGNTIIGKLLQFYDDKNLKETTEIVNNGIVTEYFYNNVPGFVLNGCRKTITLQTGEKIEIFPKEEFETGRIIGGSHSLHFADGSWGKRSKQTPAKIKLLAARCPINIMSYQQHRKANARLKLDGKYQKWYWENVK